MQESRNEKNTGVFFDAIYEDSKALSAQIIKDADKFKSERIKSAKKAAAAEYNEYVHKNRTIISRQIGKRLLEEEREEKQNVIRKRQEILEKIFLEAKVQLVDFTKNESEYREFLRSCASEIAKICGGNDIIFYVKPDDIKFSDDIVTAAGCGKCEADSNIEIGGLSALCETKKLHIIDTLDERLEEQKPWFLENSGLNL